MSNIYRKAAERFFEDLIDGRTKIYDKYTTGSCNMLLKVGASMHELRRYQDLFDCHGGNSNNFEAKYNKSNKKNMFADLSPKAIEKINEIRVLALLFASHALED